MIDKLGHLLPPLNFWDKGKFQFDPWQKQVITMIQQKKSILIRAPTSSGKSFIAMSTGILHKKILYVCPAKPVVFQVGANFVKMGYKVHYLVENYSQLSYDKQTNIFIGTPDIIELNLPSLGNRFDYVVFDEIHTLNDYHNGLSYENIIKCIECPVLALSATIKNIDFLKDILQKFNQQDFEFIDYQDRFINIQRYIYNNQQLKKLHPFICYDLNTKDSLNHIHFTPNDCYSLYESIENEFEIYINQNELLEDLIDSLSPDEFFQEDQLITLQDTKKYEKYLKSTINKLSESYPQLILNIQDKFKIESTKNDFDIISFFNQCKISDCFPMIYFHIDTSIIYELFIQLDSQLKESEMNHYPYHYDILETKNTYYIKYIDKRNSFESSIKIKTKDAIHEKANKLKEFDLQEKNIYISNMIQYYDTCIHNCKRGDHNMKHIQMKNLEKEKQSFIHNPDFRYQDIFQKHRDFCYTQTEPMSGDQIKSIRRDIYKNTGVKIEYENPLFQLLKRGIGIYIESMPEQYNWTIQKLMSEKKLGIVFSDRTLCLGIDLPIRSVALSGYKDPIYTTSDYLQMSGRAGRRGKDTVGNIIFHNISNYLDLMKGDLPKIVGSKKPMYDSYNVIHSLQKSITFNMITKERIFQDINPILWKHIHYEDPRFLKLVWYLRYYSKGEQFVNMLLKIEKKIFRIHEDLRIFFLLEKIQEYLFQDISLDKLYKQTNYTFSEKNIIREIGRICIYLGKILNETKYLITRQTCYHLLTICKDKL